MLARLYKDALLEGDENLTTLAFPANDSGAELHLTAYKVLAVFGTELRLAMTHKQDFVGDQCTNCEDKVGAPSPKVMPPTAIDIPFRQLMSSAAFGSADDTPPFFGRHLKSMTSVQFIEDGAWAGFEAFPARALRILKSYNNHRVIFNEAIAGLRFKASPSSANSNMLMLTSTRQSHRYGIEDFYFNGTIMKDTGAMVMIRIGLHTRWQTRSEGLMTPFGILFTGSHGSWYWFWKEDWTRSR